MRETFIKKMKWLLLSFPFAFFYFCQTATGGTVTLAWKPNPEPNIAGYRVKYGTLSGVYPWNVYVSGKTNITISGLDEGIKYFFVVTAVNSDERESRISKEVASTVGALSIP